MAITCAVQRGNSVYVYGDKGASIGTLQGVLQGYTSNSVSVIRGSTVYVYELSSSGHSLRSVGSHPCR